ncbi:MAG: hypothetical protein JHC38_06010 [Thiotrichales bacterium]|nr:hypothetical protein [Thiotrichales bacterium]
MDDNNSPKNPNDTKWTVEELYRACDTFLHNVAQYNQVDEPVRRRLEVEYLHRNISSFFYGIERQIQVDELVRDGLDRNLAVVVVGL